jgi:hypothetical protein
VDDGHGRRACSRDSRRSPRRDGWCSPSRTRRRSSGSRTMTRRTRAHRAGSAGSATRRRLRAHAARSRTGPRPRGPRHSSSCDRDSEARDDLRGPRRHSGRGATARD